MSTTRPMKAKHSTLASGPGSRPNTALDRLRTIYAHPGPYTSVFLGTQDGRPDTDLTTLERELKKQQAPAPAIKAVLARLGQPPVEHTAALVVLAAADGTTVVDHAQEPPRYDMVVVDTLPYVAPLLEWQQRRVAHVIVTIDDAGADILLFGDDHNTRSRRASALDEDLVADVVAEVERMGAELVVIAGLLPDQTRRLAQLLIERVPVGCRVVAEPEIVDVDELANAAVRLVSDTTARATVGYLRELRFLAAHDSAVDGTNATIAALRDRKPDVVLIHDDPADQRRVWLRGDADALSVEKPTDTDVHARLVDAVIRSAVLQGIEVRIIPTTGATGPDGDVAAMYRDPTFTVDK